MPTRVYIHGLDSSSQGTKGAFFRERYPDMIADDFFGPIEERIGKLNTVLDGRKDLILVGSSYGGLMATVFACENENRVIKLILLAPAIGLPEFRPFMNHVLTIPVTIFHGSHDELLPAGPTYDIARKVFMNLAFNVVDDDHSLHRTFATLNWDELLS